jgi:hypothetical protein
MNRDLSKVAAIGVAAIKPVVHNEKRLETGSGRHRLSRLEHIRAKNFHDQAAGHA